MLRTIASRARLARGPSPQMVVRAMCVKREELPEYVIESETEEGLPINGGAASQALFREEVVYDNPDMVMQEQFEWIWDDGTAEPEFAFDRHVNDPFTNAGATACLFAGVFGLIAFNRLLTLRDYDKARDWVRRPRLDSSAVRRLSRSIGGDPRCALTLADSPLTPPPSALRSLRRTSATGAIWRI